MRPPRSLIVAASAITLVCAAATALVLSDRTCASDSAATSAYLNRATPGVYITSIDLFATDLLASDCF